MTEHTHDLDELVAGGTAVREALDAGTALAGPKALLGGDGRRFFSVVVPGGGRVELIDLDKLEDETRERPRRKAGTVTVQDAPSFVGYVGKHALADTEVWADITTTAVVAVLNAHGAATTDGDLEGLAGHGDHRAILRVRETPAWRAWLAYDGKMLGQVAFAEHVEDRLVDIVEPSGAEMLELAQTFSAKRTVEFDASKRVKSGETTLSYRETETEAKAGKRGEVAIPDEFVVALTPFEGGPAFRVKARLRYRITDDGLRLGYKLDRPDDVKRSAFSEIVQEIAGGIDAPVWNGTP